MAAGLCVLPIHTHRTAIDIEILTNRTCSIKPSANDVFQETGKKTKENGRYGGNVRSRASEVLCSSSRCSNALGPMVAVHHNRDGRGFDGPSVCWEDEAGELF